VIRAAPSVTVRSTRLAAVFGGAVSVTALFSSDGDVVLRTIINYDDGS
jgi:hypothetical protein